VVSDACVDAIDAVQHPMSRECVEERSSDRRSLKHDVVTSSLVHQRGKLNTPGSSADNTVFGPGGLDRVGQSDAALL
jgi:hypothetical protein